MTDIYPAITQTGSEDLLPSTNDGLSLEGVSARRGSKMVLTNVGMHAPGGAITALIGPNGAGKSSIIAAILGLLPITNGRLRLHGADVHAMDRLQRAQAFGYVPQRTRLFAPMPVSQVVAMGRYAFGGSWFGPNHHRAAVRDALEMVDAGHLAARPFTELSAGESQRVLVARALVGGARTLLLDEPTSSLDIGHALVLLKLLKRLAHSGHTILIALHHFDQVEHVADHTILLHHGILLCAGTAKEVLSHTHITTAFGVVRHDHHGSTFRLAEDSA
jgi:iron complex transport system ATP-binding protein